MSESILPVAIIGAGLGGIATGIALQTQLGCYDYQIFEMSNGIGGTWLENTYPGCACDVPCHWYSLSTELNPNWSQLYVGYKEIRSYWERVAAKHDIVSHIQFFTEVLSLVSLELRPNFSHDRRCDLPFTTPALPPSASMSRHIDLLPSSDASGSFGLWY